MFRLQEKKHFRFMFAFCDVMERSVQVRARVRMRRARALLPKARQSIILNM